MAGYSGTPLIKKLGIKQGLRNIFINEPQTFRSELGLDMNLGEKLDGEFNYIHFFTKDRDELTAFFSKVRKYLKKDGALWISWPKKSSGVETDLNENIVRDIGLENQLVDVKVAAIDDIWSGLKFVFRLKDR